MVAKRRQQPVTMGPAPSFDRRFATQEPQDRLLSWVLWTFAILGVGLRLGLFWVNPPRNSFDDHFAPIFWIMKYGSLPRKDALWQSYQPPVFYVVSALVGRIALALGSSAPLLLKVFQFVSCAAGILTLGITYRILEKLPLSRFARVIAFGAASFLPVHIYQCAMHSNDTISNLSVAVCCWLMLVARERSLPTRLSALLGLALAITLFTKYTTFVVLPMMFALLIPIRPSESDVPAKRLAAAWGLTIAVPLLVLGAYCFANWKTYGQALPWNTALLDPSRSQPRSLGGLSFITFKPWEAISTPILAPWNLDSFWTLIHGRMWFDLEPKFLYFLDSDAAWWGRYYGWLRGEQAFPAGIPWTRFTRFTGSTLVTLGLVPLGMLIVGLVRCALPKARTRSRGEGPRNRHLQILPVLLAANAAGVVYLTMRSPVYSSIKPTYLLNSLPAWAALIGLGVESLERRRVARAIVIVGFGALFMLVTVHILQIVAARGFWIGS